MSAIWRRVGQLRLQGVPFAAAMRQARAELDPDYRRQAAEIWRQLEATPGFNAELKDARRDLQNGLGTPFRDVRRER